MQHAKNVEKPNKQINKNKEKNNIQKNLPETNAFCYFVLYSNSNVCFNPEGN